VRWLTYVAACLTGFVLALLGDEPLLGLLIVAVVLYPIGTGLIIRADSTTRGPVRPSLGPALLAGAAGTLLIAFLLRLAFDAPSWVDPTSADCGGPSVGAQEVAVWIAAAVFVVAALPEAVTVTAIGRRLRDSKGPDFPVSLSLFPIAVAFSGLALIVVSFVTSC
jgi:disulfide bond formation protein DsbB